jgi:hypothetical protein
MPVQTRHPCADDSFQIVKLPIMDNEEGQEQRLLLRG